MPLGKALLPSIMMVLFLGIVCACAEREPNNFFDTQTSTPTVPFVESPTPSDNTATDLQVVASLSCQLEIVPSVVVLGQMVSLTISSNQTFDDATIAQIPVGTNNTLTLQTANTGAFDVVGEVFNSNGGSGTCSATLTVLPPAMGPPESLPVPTPPPPALNPSPPRPTPPPPPPPLKLRPIYRYFVRPAYHVFSPKTLDEFRGRRGGEHYHQEGTAFNVSLDYLPNSFEVYECYSIGGPTMIQADAQRCAGVLKLGYLLHSGTKPIYQLLRPMPLALPFYTKNLAEAQHLIREGGYQDQGILGYEP